jgi:hypothetical protein
MPDTPDELLVIIPTRGRPLAVPEILQAWRDTGATADLLFAVDEDDPARDAYIEQGKRANDEGHFPLWTVGPRLRLCGTLNQAAALMADRYRYLAFLGDDHRPRPAAMPWDARIRWCTCASTWSGSTGAAASAASPTCPT